MQATIYNTRPIRETLSTEPADSLPATAIGSLAMRLNSIFWHAVASLALALCIIAAPLGATSNTQLKIQNQQSQVLSNTGAPQTSRYFSVTSKTVRGDFLATFNRYGLHSIGYPLSDERQENGRTIQYFERVRMERHPELAYKGYGVLMTRLGDDLSSAKQPFAGAAKAYSTRTVTYFKQTNHTLSGAFLTYWKANGGVQRFGYPISEPTTENGLYVQWFERARFERHPELANKGQTVQLSLLGSLAYDKALGRANTHDVLSVPIEPAQQAAPNPKPEIQNPKSNEPALSSMESYLLTKVNEQRASLGLGSVQSDLALVELARSRSNDMATRNYFSHTTPEGATFLGMLNTLGVPYKYAGEILARNNYAESEAAPVALTSYLNSPPHKAIMLDKRYTLVGVGYAKSHEDDMHYFTVLFAER